MPMPIDGACSTPLELGRIAATLSVSDMSRALLFYTEVVGLRKVFENGDPVGFAILANGPAELHLTLNPKHQATSRNVAHMMISDATQFYEHLAANRVKIVKGLRDANYGLRGFVFADPDGNRIDVGQVLK